jgi:osmotically-inducible protein OsmY
MKTFAATLLAAAIGASFAAHAADAPTDSTGYRNMTQKAAADYKAATANCAGMSGSARAVCVEEAKVARARTESDAVVQHNNTEKLRVKARTALAEAEYGLAKAKCAIMTGAEKTSCTSAARSMHTAALADAKADRAMVASTGINPVTSTTTRDPAKAAAVDECAQVAGSPNTGCLIQHEGKTIADRTDRATDRAAVATGTAAQRTENAAERAADRTENTAERMADRTERATDRAADKTRDAAATVAQKTERAGEKIAATSSVAAAKTGEAVSDAVITTKIKAGLVKEPDLSALAIRVETEDGVVMLSGFVDSKNEIERAVKVAKNVQGVTDVKSALKVKSKDK